MRYFAALFLLAASLSAEGIYTDRNQFLAAAGAVTNITFDAIDYYDGKTTIVGDVTFEPYHTEGWSSGSLYVVDGYGASGWSLYTDAPQTFALTATGFYAAGANVYILDPWMTSDATIGFATSAGGSGSIYLPAPAPGDPYMPVGFIGIVSATPLEWVRFDRGYEFIDDFVYSTAPAAPSAVPEPASGLLLLTGVAVLYWRKKLSRR